MRHQAQMARAFEETQWLQRLRVEHCGMRRMALDAKHRYRVHARNGFGHEQERVLLYLLVQKLAERQAEHMRRGAGKLVCGHEASRAKRVIERSVAALIVDAREFLARKQARVNQKTSQFPVGHEHSIQ